MKTARKTRVAHRGVEHGFKPARAASGTAVMEEVPVALAAEPGTASEEAEAALAERLVAEVEGRGTDVTELCQTYHLKREELGRLTGFSLRALAEWASGNPQCISAQACAGGTNENSPTLQRWVRASRGNKSRRDG